VRIMNTEHPPKLTRMGGSLAVGLVPVACVTVMLRLRLQMSCFAEDNTDCGFLMQSLVRWVAVAKARAPTRSGIPERLTGCGSLTQCMHRLYQ
jgi:hypothetical protein